MVDNEYVIEPLTSKHEKKSFNCGVEALNNYLKTLAIQHQERNISRTFVIHEKSDKKILGFYSLATGSLNCATLPESVKHPKYPVSVVRLARLAVDMRSQGKSFGKRLLVDALKKCHEISRSVGVFGVVVDAKDNIAVAFYKQYGFYPLDNEPLCLFIPIKMIEELFNE